jgi:hypothetical protein
VHRRGKARRELLIYLMRRMTSSLVPIELRREAVEIPEEPVRRLVWAREILMQALGEIRIGFGKGGGLVGKELEGLAEGVGREIGALRSAAGGRIAI